MNTNIHLPHPDLTDRKATVKVREWDKDTTGRPYVSLEIGDGSGGTVLVYIHSVEQAFELAEQTSRALRFLRDAERYGTVVK